MELNYLRNIVTVLLRRCDSNYCPNPYQLKRQLFGLKDFEKKLIKKKVLELDYNVGTLKVLKILREAGILSITEYLQSLHSDDDVQGIIADVFDSNDMLDLLTEVILSSRSSQVIGTQFEQCFKQYVNDIISRPELINSEFICKVQLTLPSEAFQELIFQRFIDELLVRVEDEENNHSVDLTKVISSQFLWNNQYKEKKFELLTKILRQLCKTHSEGAIELILKQLKSGESINWYFILFLAKHINHHAYRFDELKKFLKELFKRFHQTKSVHNLHTMLIVSRQLFHFHEDENSSYKLWVKQTIGEMHYKLKDTEKFTHAMECLTGMICYETDLAVMDAHLQTAISSPRGTNHLVLEYKQLLRTRIASISAPDIVMDLT